MEIEICSIETYNEILVSVLYLREFFSHFLLNSVESHSFIHSTNSTRTPLLFRLLQKPYQYLVRGYNLLASFVVIWWGGYINNNESYTSTENNETIWFSVMLQFHIRFWFIVILFNKNWFQYFPFRFLSDFFSLARFFSLELIAICALSITKGLL